MRRPKQSAGDMGEPQINDPTMNSGCNLHSIFLQSSNVTSSIMMVIGREQSHSRLLLAAGPWMVMEAAQGLIDRLIDLSLRASIWVIDGITSGHSRRHQLM